ncbi:uncharacterized protein LOC115925142 [Strongylocentrotus purpuratus]|uniref:Uncharacterized protein n=1 Tax=Strongylocentrotus purpuratus TaxID=7668 RepID=A0A7M7G0K6_STRPU|nr:uncharacterized protein LOC752400 [Strongylocentrotus purpuratus]XP_030844301.1 uncharacterized protein LOC115925142 [Strongylocentrotus purpuratus]|eukprot:XP_001175486.2 PREDICTED: uncharacterized protein LOC752400 [Strongylocentrotus purpuratus]
MMVEWGKVSIRSSSNNKLLGVAVAVLLLCVCVAAGQSWHCGRAAQTIMGMCNSCYASHDKRSISKPSYTPAKPFLHKRNAVHFLRTTKREIESRPSMGDTAIEVAVERRSTGNRGFIHECCNKFCDPGEMVLYCCEKRQIEWAQFHNLLKA